MFVYTDRETLDLYGDTSGEQETGQENEGRFIYFYRIDADELVGSACTHLYPFKVDPGKDVGR